MEYLVMFFIFFIFSGLASSLSIKLWRDPKKAQSIPQNNKNKEKALTRVAEAMVSQDTIDPQNIEPTYEFLPYDFPLGFYDRKSVEKKYDTLMEAHIESQKGITTHQDANEDIQRYRKARQEVQGD